MVQPVHPRAILGGSSHIIVGGSLNYVVGPASTRPAPTAYKVECDGCGAPTHHHETACSYCTRPTGRLGAWSGILTSFDGLTDAQCESIRTWKR